MSAALACAFPPSVQARLLPALRDLPPSNLAPTGSITLSGSGRSTGITVLGEPVDVPHRIYNSAPTSDTPLEGSVDATAVACLYTRHHDGFVRQRALQHVLGSDEPWTVPFIVQLLGEYVIEICDDIYRFAENDLPNRPGHFQTVRAFADENPQFVNLTRQRATSYWSCYHRHQHAGWETYPGLLALQTMLGVSA